MSNNMFDAAIFRGTDNGGAGLLDDITAWFGRFIAVTDPDDLSILTLWTGHTHLVNELYTSPRLQVDSVIFGSGKTTVLDHLNRLCLKPVQAAALSSPALLPRMLESGMRTVLLDEVDRSLRPDKPGVEDLIAIINSGYRFGATRPVLTPTAGGGWASRDMSTYAPVAMAGNSPNLPPDTVSRSIRILLMPDRDGTVEDSDWELIEDEADRLRTRIAEWADAVRFEVKGMCVDLPDKCIGRSKEKWRPLKRVAVAAGGDWPQIADRLIVKSIAEDEAEREAGLKVQPPGMVLLSDLYAIWPQDENFVPTRELVSALVVHNPDYWGCGSAYGKPLTDTRLGRLLSRSAKVTSHRPGGSTSPRGYLRTWLEPVWHRLGIAPYQPDQPDQPDQPGSNDDRVDWVDQHDRVDTDTPPGAQHGENDDREPTHDEATATVQSILGGRVVDDDPAPPLCPVCGRAKARTDSGMCDLCTIKHNHQNQTREASA
jgi:hypothetical protein